MADKFRIYRKNAQPLKCNGEDVYIRKGEVNSTFMGQTTLTFTIHSAYEIPWEAGCFVTIDGNKYTLKYIPSAKKQSRRGTYGQGFVYDNVVMLWEADDFTRIEFLDYVEEDNEIHFSNMPTVYFYGGVSDLVSRIFANINRIYPDKWTYEFKGSVTSKEKNLTFQNIKCWEALTKVWDEFDVLFYIQGTHIIFGTKDSLIDYTFMYGKGKGLKSIKTNTSADNEIITRLHVYGSKQNIPYRYYNKLDGISESMYITNLMLPAVRLDEGIVYYNINGEVTTKVNNVWNNGSPVFKMVREGSGNTLDIYLESIRGVNQFGILEGSVTFDNDSTEGFVNVVDDEKGIYPHNTTYNTLKWAEQMTDDGVLDEQGTVTPATWEMEIEVDFDLLESLQDQAATLSFKSGKLVGREYEFDATEVTTSTPNMHRYRLIANRIPDNEIGLAFPNKNYNAKVGDTYVLLNITQPDSYVKNAEQRLLNAGLWYLSDNDHSKYTIEPEIDNIFMANNSSVAQQIIAGNVMKIEDEDILDEIGTDNAVSMPISNVKMTFGDEIIRHYSVTLAESVDLHSTIVNRVIKEISVKGGANGVIGGLNKSDVLRITEPLFLRKDKADSAKEKITFEKGLVSNTIYNSDKITTKDLEVTGSAHFFELVIDKAKAVGGQMILSPANAVLDEVVASTNNTYYLRFKNTDGNKSIAAGFEVGDLIICQTFNTVSGNNVSNKFYWAEVLSVTKLGISAEEVDTPTVMSLDEAIEESPSSPSDADEDVSEAEEYSSDMWQIKIQLDNTHSATNCNGVPSAGDNIVVLGNKNGGSRSNAIVISAVDSTYLMPFYTKDTGEIVEILSPSIISYKNIRAYGLDDKQDTIISPTLNVFTGELRVDTSGGSVAVKTETARDYRFRGTTTFSAPEEPTNLTWSTWGTTQHVEPSTTNKYIWKGVRISYSNGTYDYSVEYDGMLSDASSSSGEPGKDAIDLVVTKDFTSTLAAEEPSSAYDYTNGYFKLTPTTSCTVKLMQDGSPITSGVTYTFQCKGCYFTYGQSLAQSQQGSNVTITYVDKTAKTYTISGTSKTIYVPVTTPTVTFSAVYKGETYQKTIIVPVDYSKRWSTFVVDKEQISLKVNDLSTGLKQTGIDITTGEIELTADKVSFKTDDPNNQLQTIIEGGQIRSGSLVSDNGDGKVVTVANGMATFSVGNGCVEIGVDSDGNPMLYGMTINSDGTKQVLWSVGAEGTSSTSELKGKFENVKQATYTLSGQYSQYINISLELADIRMIAGTLAKNFAAGAVKVKIIGLGGITQTYSSVASVSVPSQGYVVREPLGFFGSDTFTQSLTEDGTGAPKWRGKTHVITAELRVQDELLATYNYSLKID